MAFRTASRSVMDIPLKFGRSSENLIITGSGGTVGLQGLFGGGGPCLSAMFLEALLAGDPMKPGPVGGERAFLSDVIKRGRK
jgi:hypothetical protein